MSAAAIIAILLTAIGLVGGFGAWMAALTFNYGRLVERVATMLARLEKGDASFAEIRAEQTEMAQVLASLESLKQLEARRTGLLAKQTQALWVVVARIDPRFATAAAAAAAQPAN